MSGAALDRRRSPYDLEKLQVSQTSGVCLIPQRLLRRRNILLIGSEQGVEGRIQPGHHAGVGLKGREHDVLVRIGPALDAALQHLRLTPDDRKRILQIVKGLGVQECSSARAGWVLPWLLEAQVMSQGR